MTFVSPSGSSKLHLRHKCTIIPHSHGTRIMITDQISIRINCRFNYSDVLYESVHYYTRLLSQQFSLIIRCHIIIQSWINPKTTFQVVCCAIFFISFFCFLLPLLFLLFRTSLLWSCPFEVDLFGSRFLYLFIIIEKQKLTRLFLFVCRNVWRTKAGLTLSSHSVLFLFSRSLNTSLALRNKIKMLIMIWK